MIDWNFIYINLRDNPTHPCAGYKTIVGHREKYLAVYGQSQLEEDYRQALERSKR